MLPRGYSEAALEIEEGATRPVRPDRGLVGSSDLMVPRPRYAAKLDEQARPFVGDRGHIRATTRA